MPPILEKMRIFRRHRRGEPSHHGRPHKRRRWIWGGLGGLAVILAGYFWLTSARLLNEPIRIDYGPLDASFLNAMGPLTGADFIAGNHVQTLPNGDGFFPPMLQAIKDAKKTITLESYIWSSGYISNLFIDALTERARAGVKVHVLLDGMGGLKLNRSDRDRLRNAGVQFNIYGREHWWEIKPNINHRTHRKLLIVDGTVGFTGGVGIAEEWTGNAQDPEHWRDTHVRVIGPVVRGLQGAFAENWLECTGDVLAGDRYLPQVEEVEDGGAMQVTRSSATIGDTNAEALLYLALAAAKRSIELTSAYFVPRPAFTDALVEAAERGVEIRILVPGSHIDKEFVRTAGRAAYDALLGAGIEIYEYCPTMLHAKTLTVDGCWSSVGSVNFDNRSFQLHDEVTLCVQSERFAGLLHDVFERDLESSERIEPTAWAARPQTQRAREAVTKYARREL